MTFDLHLHTNYSDGNWSPQELVDEAHKLGLKTIAITDHDTVDGIEPACLQAVKYGLNIVPAVEISTSYNGKDLHVLGYFINSEDAGFVKLLCDQKEARVNHVQRLAKSAGIDPEFILNFGVKGTIGKAHIAKALVAYGVCSDLNEAYFQYLMPNGKYFQERKFVETKTAVEVLKKSGAIAVLAHPPEKNLENILTELLEAGLAGIEAYHALFGQNTENLLSLARKYNLLVTGGSDCHGPYPPFAPQVGGVNLPDYILQNLSSRVFEHRISVGAGA